MEHKIVRYMLGGLMIALSLIIYVTGYFLNHPSPRYAILFIWLPALLSFVNAIVYFYSGAKKLNGFSTRLSLIAGFLVLVIVGASIATTFALGSGYGEIKGPLSTITMILMLCGLIIALISGVRGIINGRNTEPPKLN